MKTVRDVMRKSPVTLAPFMPVGLAARVLHWGGFRHLPVLEDGKLVGVLSERNLLAVKDRGLDMPLREVMSRPPHTIGPDAPLVEAAERLNAHKIGALVVVERGDTLGIVTTTDLLAEQVRAAIFGAERLPSDARADSVMTREVIDAKPNDMLLDAVARMSAFGIRHLPVTDAERRVVGILSDRDVRMVVGDPLGAITVEETRVRVSSMRVGDVMTRSPLTVGLDASFRELVSAFVDLHVGAVPVVDEEDRLIGIISYVDILRNLLASPNF